MPIDPKAVKWDTPDPNVVQWDGAKPGFLSQAADVVKAIASGPANAGQNVKTLRDVAAGALRGAGSIGVTLLTPYDMLAGNTKSIGNPERRQAMDDALREMGASPDSVAYGAGKLGAEVAGTLGVGPALAAPLKAAPMLAPVADAVATGGMQAGGLSGAAGLAARSAGGLVTGGASAGLVNPEEAAAGAGVGAVLPGALKVAGSAGQAVGRTLRGPEQSSQMAQAVRDAQSAGYVIPPSQARPTLANRLLEGLSGKISTAQNASARNQAVTNRLAAESLGLAPETQITPELLKQLRADAGSSYAQIKTLGDMTGDQLFFRQLAGLKGAYEGAAKDFPGLAKPELSNLLDSLRQPTFKASSAVDAIGLLRDEADQAFRAGAKGTAKALRAASVAMEDLVERNLLRMNASRSLDSILRAGGSAQDIVQAGVSNPASQMLQQFRDARKMIAKTYSVENALNASSGSVDARRLAAQVNKGKPLSGPLLDAANFANQFPKAAQSVESMGSLPQLSPLDWAAGGAMSAATSNPLFFAATMARPAARRAALSPVVQSRLVQPAATPSMAAWQDPALQALFYRGAPVLAADR